MQGVVIGALAGFALYGGAALVGIVRGERYHIGATALAACVVAAIGGLIGGIVG